MLKNCAIAECYFFKIISRCTGRQGRNKIISKNKSKTKLYLHNTVRGDVAVYTNISRETNHFDFAWFLFSTRIPTLRAEINIQFVLDFQSQKAVT